MNKRRFSEIDVVRGVAVVGMVIYHVLFDLSLLGLIDLRISRTAFEILAWATAGTFFTVVGISLYISFSRTRSVGPEQDGLLGKYLVRGAKLVAWGLGITLVSYLLYPDFAVFFGALHFIGVSVVLSYFFLELTFDFRKSVFLFLVFSMALLLFALSGAVRGSRVEHPFLLWIGMVPQGFQSLDYFPLLPWFGFVVGGLAIGELLYPGGRRSYDFYAFENRPLEFLGRYSLIIYLAHQPLIYLAIFLFLSFSSGGGSSLSSLLSF
ncbi:DUF1624 domain-containing protein [Candidatus Bipolaricaulota bacterium]|nr:DUF1624 domain-containing protein [Candidatus Bipolaricaulota bacterium]